MNIGTATSLAERFSACPQRSTLRAFIDAFQLNYAVCGLQLIMAINDMLITNIRLRLTPLVIRVAIHHLLEYRSQNATLSVLTFNAPFPGALCIAELRS